MKRIALMMCALVIAFTSILPSTAFAQAYEEGENAPGSTYVAPEATYDIPLQTFSLRRSTEAVAKADFIFFIDSTGSMRSYINSVKSNLMAFSLYLQAKGIDVRFAVVDFKDITSDGAGSTVVHSFGGSVWTSDPAQVEATLEKLNISGGGDDAETPTNAYEVLWSNPALVSREDASTFSFLLTDATAKESDFRDDIIDLDVLSSYLRRTSVHTSVVSKLAYQNHYSPLYDQTGGIFIDIDSMNYYELMLQVADWIIESLNDSDHDGLLDTWETKGVDTDNDGIIDLDLPAMGADPAIPDLFIEVDWMQREESTSYVLMFPIKEKAISLRPSNTALQAVIDQFADHGIQLHIDAGSDSIMNPKTGATWGTLSRSNTLEYSDNTVLGDKRENWNQLAIENFDQQRWNVFRYCMCLNKYDASLKSGLAEGTPGQFFIIADTKGGKGIFASDRKTAGTFMHELGHTLGLQHGGDESGDNGELNYKTNYLSIMNYLYQLTGLLGTNEINYSDFELPAMNENIIDEQRGIDPNGLTAGTGLGAKWYYDGLIFSEGSAENIAGSAINFNNNLSIENSVSIDLNNRGGLQTFRPSINDWEHLIFKGGAIGGMGASLEESPLLIYKDTSEEIMDELSLEEAEEMGVLGNPDDCQITSITPDILYTNSKDQSLDITIKNLFVQATTAELTVSSDLLAQRYQSSVTLQASEEKTIILPIADDVQAGNYTVTCVLSCANGETITKAIEIEVQECTPIMLAVGQTLPLEGTALDLYTFYPADVTIIKVAGKAVTGLRTGSTFIEATDADGRVVASIPVEVYDGMPKTGDAAHPAVWLSLLSISLAAMLLTIKKRKAA